MPAVVRALLLLALLPLAVRGQAPAAPVDSAVWPNAASWRNSDPWLVEHHALVRELRPRVLVLSFANDVSPNEVRTHARGVVAANAEASRFHGFDDPAAKSALVYQLERIVDLRDSPVPAERAHLNSSLFPRKAEGVLLDYGALYTQAFAERLGYRDPRDPTRWLTLHELIDQGWINELWIYLIHEEGSRAPALETCEQKQYYDADGKPRAGVHGPAGNGQDEGMPWSGRSFRITFFNPHRGVGCGMENFGHTLEAIANWDAIGAYTPLFREFAELDLDRRFGLPFASLYALGAGDEARYPEPGVIEVLLQGKVHRARPYTARGGSCHFPPGASKHYDLYPAARPISTIEGWRQGGGPGGADRAKPIDPERWRPYEAVAPDCMGAWTVYWRQCMPGPASPCRDDRGRPLKSWWPYLFY